MRAHLSAFAVPVGTLLLAVFAHPSYPAGGRTPVPFLDQPPFPARPFDRALVTPQASIPPRLRAGEEAAWAADWAQRIDATWGASPLSVAQMLSVFDQFWNTVDERFACFEGLGVDWLLLRARYRPEIEQGVSRGRFAAILNHLALALEESHTAASDRVVTVLTAPVAGVPLMVVGGWGDNSHFGAGLTPLPNDDLLVYRVVPEHPLGLELGDIVLGYEGVRWKDIYPKLLAAELPLSGWWWGSSPSSLRHSMLMSAGMNWHLFQTIDIVKHATGDTLHLPVGPLALLGGYLDCTEQLPVPGVPRPAYLETGDPVSWGIVEGSSIGYVYVRAWSGTAGTQFLDAVDSLMRVHDTSGLIVDFRTNYGGNMFLAYGALELLFDRDVETIAFDERCVGGGHLDFCPSPNGLPAYYVIHGDPLTFYDRPIAVLVGPGALSSGDQVANLMRYHPNARVFGRSTATAFNAPIALNLGQPNLSARFAAADAYRLSDPANHLTHDEFPVDEPVWLEPDDVALGFDSVVGAALNWIGYPAAVGTREHPVRLGTIRPNPSRGAIRIPFELPEPLSVQLAVYDVAGRLVRTLRAGGPTAPGAHAAVWDRRDGTGAAVRPGVYLVRLAAAGRVATRRVVALE